MDIIARCRRMSTWTNQMCSFCFISYATLLTTNSLPHCFHQFALGHTFASQFFSFLCTFNFLHLQSECHLPAEEMKTDSDVFGKEFVLGVVGSCSAFFESSILTLYASVRLLSAPRSIDSVPCCILNPLFDTLMRRSALLSKLSLWEPRFCLLWLKCVCHSMGHSSRHCFD